MIDVSNITKEFTDPKRGTIKALDEVSFTCDKSEIFGLLGPNGAGKSTLLRIISTLIKPTTGSAHLAGFDVATQGDSVRRNLGFLSSETALYPRLSPREHLKIYGQFYDYPSNLLERRIVDLIEMMDMRDFADVWCEKLSSGMKQRASIARAVVHDPPVIILDEPTNGLDVPSSQSLYKCIRKFREQGKCVVFSSHIMSDVERLCDRIAIIDHGRLVAIGSIEQLQNQTGESSVQEIFLSITDKERI
jgi:sodium transport system ATP-binding protein